MIGALSTIDEQRWRLAHVQNEDIHFAVVIDVPKSSAAPRRQGQFVQA